MPWFEWVPGWRRCRGCKKPLTRVEAHPFGDVMYCGACCPHEACKEGAS